MKKRFLFARFYVLLIVINICQSCGQVSSERIYFTINSMDRKIVLPLLINDSITVNLAFDSGANLGTLILDSSFCEQHPSIKENAQLDTILSGGSSWSEMSIPISIYKFPPKVKIENTDLDYTYMTTYNWKWYFNTDDSKGMFNIPCNDTIHVWELNFENNYLAIHNAEKFSMPADCFVAPLIVSDNGVCPFNIELPMKIFTADGDTLILSRKYCIDTGMPWDIALMHRAPEQDFFNEQKDAVWTGYLNSYHRYYTVSATLFDNFYIDSLRIYTFNYSNSIRENYLMGQNFLKRFNVFFNLKDQLIGLQPIDNFQRVIDPLAKRFHFSMYQTDDGRIIVKEVADYEKNYYKTAGMQEGDEIVSVNNKLFKDITPNEIQNFHKHDTLVYAIIRNGKPLEIVVQVDKNEVQGD